MKISNLKNIQEPSYTPIPGGKYNLIIAKAENRIAKESGNAYILIGLRVLDDDPKGVKGRYVFANINNNDIGLSILKSLLTYNGSPLAELEGDVEFDPSSLIGMKTFATVTVDKDNKDELRNNVRYFKPVQPAFADATLDIFNKEETAYNANQHRVTSSTDDDDLPFN